MRCCKRPSSTALSLVEKELADILRWSILGALTVPTGQCKWMQLFTKLYKQKVNPQFVAESNFQNKIRRP